MTAIFMASYTTHRDTILDTGVFCFNLVKVHDCIQRPLLQTDQQSQPIQKHRADDHTPQHDLLQKSVDPDKVHAD